MAKIIVHCTNCNAEISKYKSELKYSKSGQFFCNKKCRGEYATKQVKKHSFTCKNCNEEFFKTEREIKNYQAKGNNIVFCSKKCMLEYNSVPMVEVKCDTCNKTLIRRKTEVYQTNFCNMDCLKKYKKMITLTCEHCKNDFQVAESYYKKQEKRGQSIRFCSKKCMHESLRNDLVEITCCICNKAFHKNKNKINKLTPDCCSIECRDEYLNRENRVIVHCHHCGEELIRTKYRAEHTKHHFCNIECYNEHRARIKETYKQLSHYLRTSKEYESWRDDVYKRDHYACRKCGSKEKLHAHHIITLYDICVQYNMDLDEILTSELFNDRDNGITLCPDCHQKEHPFIRNEKGQFCRPNSKPLES
jgi:hypothetical protein